VSRPGAALRVELAPSPRLAAALAGLHAVAAGCALMVLPAALGAPAAAALLVLGASAASRRALLRSRRAVRRMIIDGTGLELTLANGERQAAQPAARRYVGRWLVTLPLTCTGPGPRRRVLLVTRDMLDAEAFRRLRIWALWGSLPAVAAKQLPA
jgi:hypothetical protein